MVTRPGVISVRIVVFLWLVGTGTASGEGHGPVFGLATPTLGREGWSSDTVAMSLTTGEGTTYMFREMIGYGITEDVQAALTFPLAPPIDRLKAPPRTRVGSMMGAFGDVEGSLMWRFHRQATGIGSRFESTLFAAGSLPTEDRRGGVKVGPSVHLAAVTGYASRTVYGWVGGGYQRYFSEGRDRLGDLPYLSAVFGWRPPLFRHDYPKPDWRLFIEGLAEFPQRDRIEGVKNPNSGGNKVLVGPSVLGLYGKWGVAAGILFPIHQDTHGEQIEEQFRAKLVFTYWF